MRVRIARWLAEKIAGRPVEFGVFARVQDDDSGWMRAGRAPHDRDDIYEHYNLGFAINSPVMHETGT